MDKYKNIISRIEEEQRADEEQRKLHRKYKDIEKNVIIKEKGNFVEYILRISANIILAILAAIGLLALIYKNPRMELISVIEETINQIINMF